MQADVEAAYLAYEKLMRQYDAVGQLAGQARRKISRQYYECTQGRGTGPDSAQLGAAEYLDREAAALWSAILQHLKETFPS